jgi:hypothetical protein
MPQILMKHREGYLRHADRILSYQMKDFRDISHTFNEFNVQSNLDFNIKKETTK